MAAAKRKPVARRKPQPSAKKHAKAMAPRRKGKKGESKFGRYVLPAVLSTVIIGCIGFLVVMGYRTVTASNFFDVKTVDVRGVHRSSGADIQKIVTGQTEKSGAWNADLPDLKMRIEKLPFIKSAAVSRVLPNGIRVNVVERIPVAVARLQGGDFLIDADGEVLATVNKNDQEFPMVIRGWDEAKSEKATKDNLQRIKLFQKMSAEWSQFDLGSRIREIDLSSLSEPKVVVEDSGAQIPISLQKENFGKILKTALEAIAGKGEKIKSVNAAGVYPVIEYAGN
ncbi:MAG TPA: FtsQ-type POTRA domain-containing protein [Pyrinomonadaceae bacterium]|jgi:cell division septal protein FtsQ|nr:FtsQ-type POTRA domain-containing protein [Pyrinomonadaceae bacterium]